MLNNQLHNKKHIILFHKFLKLYLLDYIHYFLLLIYNPTILDINKFYPLYDEIEYILLWKKYYLLSKINISVYIRKSTFFEENELIKGIIPDSFGVLEDIELYHLIYPGMKIEYPIKFLSLIKVTISPTFIFIHFFYNILFIWHFYQYSYSNLLK